MNNGGCSSFGRVSGCGSEGSGFDPRQSPHFKFFIINKYIVV
jgi:hypothetical protein